MTEALQLVEAEAQYRMAGALQAVAKARGQVAGALQMVLEVQRRVAEVP